MNRLINLSLALLVLLAAESTSQHSYNSFYVDDAFVNHIQARDRSEDATIVMIPGLNLSTYIYVTTPDGRRGWGNLFADRGYDVYMVNDPRFDFATGGFVDPFTVPENAKEATPSSEQGWQRDIWRRWGFGPSQGDPYPDARFPTDHFDVFAENYPYIGNSSQRFSDAIQTVIDSIPGKVWLVAHSAGSGDAVIAARQSPGKVMGLILIEPAGPPDANDFPDLSGLHMLGVYGDYIESRNQTGRKLATEEAATLFENAGGVATVVSLPEDSLVFGNSHLMMQDRNSEQVFSVIERWLQQFSMNTNVAVGDNHHSDDVHIYPNPVANHAWLNSPLFDGCDYSIHAVNGSLLKMSTVVGQQIDLQGTTNGLLFVGIQFQGRTVTLILLKSGG